MVEHRAWNGFIGLNITLASFERVDGRVAHDNALLERNFYFNPFSFLAGKPAGNVELDMFCGWVSSKNGKPFCFGNILFVVCVVHFFSVVSEGLRTKLVLLWGEGLLAVSRTWLCQPRAADSIAVHRQEGAHFLSCGVLISVCIGRLFSVRQRIFWFYGARMNMMMMFSH